MDHWDELEYELYQMQLAEDAGCAAHVTVGYLHHVHTHHTVDQDLSVPF